MLKISAIVTLGKDATVNNVSGKNVINFSGAHSERFKDNQGNQKEKTTWVDFSKWGESTAVAPYLKKGTKVYVEGFPEIRTYTTASGETKASLTVRITQLELLGGGGNSEQGNDGGYAAPAANYNAPQGNDMPDDDLPF